jgi:hypothetical protein
MAGSRHGMCELARQGNGMGTVWYVWISLKGDIISSHRLLTMQSPPHTCTVTCRIAHTSCYLTSRSSAFQELTFPHLVKKLEFYKTQRFITAFTRIRHLSLPWARSFQPISSQSIYLSAILILSVHLRLGNQICSLPSRFPNKILYFFLPHACNMTCP